MTGAESCCPVECSKSKYRIKEYRSLVSFEKLPGMVPRSFLPPRSRLDNRKSRESLEGIVPVNPLLLDIQATYKFVAKDETISRVPFSSFLSKLKKLRFVRCMRLLGKVPRSRFPPKSRCSRVAEQRLKSGTVPDRLLSNTSKCRKCLRNEISGIVPVSRLLFKLKDS